MVDAVLHFEGDKTFNLEFFKIQKKIALAQHRKRFVRNGKKGIIFCQIPIKILLSDNFKNLDGCSISVMEGDRPFLVEVQARLAQLYMESLKELENGFNSKKIKHVVGGFRKKCGLN